MIHGDVSADNVVMWRKARLTQSLRTDTCKHTDTHTSKHTNKCTIRHVLAVQSIVQVDLSTLSYTHMT